MERLPVAPTRATARGILARDGVASSCDTAIARRVRYNFYAAFDTSGNAGLGTLGRLGAPTVFWMYTKRSIHGCA